MTNQTYPPRIMYIEFKGGGYREDQFGNIKVGENVGLHGTARIGRVTFSRTGATLHYRGKSFQSLKGSGFKANYFDVETGEQYWISGPRKDGTDRLYKSDWPVEIDEDVQEEYWTEIRKMPGWKTRSKATLTTTKRPNATSLTRL
ncbi:MAG: hypothetical protein WBQ94_16640 [Terracidiphilus sp.]